VRTKESAPLALPERNGAKKPIGQIQNLIGNDNKPNRHNLIAPVKSVWADLTPSKSNARWFTGTVQLGETLFELHAWALFNEIGTPTLRIKLQPKAGDRL